ncbi:MAG: hypothetical protein HKN24_04525 [Acidimicrobiales bacterium]|nr:hypothetical protein [Acidimicrobiales bacterium]
MEVIRKAGGSDQDHVAVTPHSASPTTGATLSFGLVAHRRQPLKSGGDAQPGIVLHNLLAGLNLGLGLEYSLVDQG